MAVLHADRTRLGMATRAFAHTVWPAGFAETVCAVVSAVARQCQRAELAAGSVVLYAVAISHFASVLALENPAIDAMTLCLGSAVLDDNVTVGAAGG